MDTGFITLHRKIISSSIWKNPGLSHLFIHLLLLATYDVDKFLWNEKEVILKRGQLITGRFSLAEATGIPASSIRNYLKILEKLGILDIKTNNKFSLITIVKYSDYQGRKEKLDSKQDSQRTARGQPEDTLNKVNKDNKETKNTGLAPEIVELLDYFKKTVNPHISFDNKTQRQACKDLLTTYGLERVKTSLAFLEQKRQTDKYLPLITTPYELWIKWAKIKQHLIVKKRKVWKPSSASAPFQLGANTN